MTRLILAIGVVLALAATGLPSASASVEVVRQRVAVVRDVAPPDAPFPPAIVSPPASPAAPVAAPRARPRPRLGVLGQAAVAPAALGARVADFVARAITRGVAGAPATQKPADPV